MSRITHLRYTLILAALGAFALAGGAGFKWGSFSRIIVELTQLF